MASQNVKFSNELTDAQAERLAILLEELGEAQQAIGKILRHGYESYNPHSDDDEGQNRRDLVKELGDIRCAVRMMFRAGDVDEFLIERRSDEKEEKIKPYLHHQERV